MSNFFDETRFIDTIVKIENSEFFNVKSYKDGGVVFVKNVKMECSNSYFNQNEAEQLGGSIRFFCDDEVFTSDYFEFCSMNIASSNFSLNKAWEGGAFSYNSIEPTNI